MLLDVFIADGSNLPSNTSVAVPFQFRPRDNSGFVLGELSEYNGLGQRIDFDTGNNQRIVSIQPGQNSASIRFWVKHDTMAESGESLDVVILDPLRFVNGARQGNFPVNGRFFRATVQVRDTHRVTMTAPPATFRENNSVVFTVVIGDGLTDHGTLGVDFDIPGVSAGLNGMRRPQDYGLPRIHHNGSGSNIPLAATYQESEGVWRGGVLFRLPDRGNAGFTITIKTVDDSEPETSEKLCVQLRDIYTVNSTTAYRLQLQTTDRVCVDVNDNDGPLRANLGAPLPAVTAEVGALARTVFPITFSAPGLATMDRPEPVFNTPGRPPGEIDPSIVTYFHYAITGTAMRGVDFTVADLPGSVFDTATGLGYLRLRPGVPGGDSAAAAHQLIINIESDTIAEGAESIIVTPRLHGHTNNLLFTDQRPSSRNPALQHRTAQAQTATIRANSPVAVSVSAVPPISVTEGGDAVFQVVCRPGP